MRTYREPDNPLANDVKLTFAYDFMGRRYSKKVYIYDTQVSDFTLQVSSSFLYNGWNMIHETTTPQSPALPVTRSYVWGLDLSQTLQGAGGVGGLLCSVHTPQSGSAATYYATADANGNITDYVNETGAVSASFTYDAFGQVVTESIAQGLEPNAFPHRFSSKYEDTETDLNYYGFRYYSAEMGRWLNRDPIEERGGVNVYGFVGNSSLNSVDFLGLATADFYVQAEQWTRLNEAIFAAEKIKDSLDRSCYKVTLKRKATSVDAMGSVKNSDVNRTVVFGHGVPTGIHVNKGLAPPRVGSYGTVTQEHLDGLKKGGFAPAYFEDHSKNATWLGLKWGNAHEWGIDSVRILTDGYMITDRQLHKAAEKSGTECSCATRAYISCGVKVPVMAS